MDENLQTVAKDSGISLDNLEEKLQDMDMNASDVYQIIMDEPELAKVYRLTCSARVPVCMLG